jgi:hypothetical protein
MKIKIIDFNDFFYDRIFDNAIQLEDGNVYVITKAGYKLFFAKEDFEIIEE